MGVRDFAKQRNESKQNTRSNELSGVRAFAASKSANPNLLGKNPAREKRNANAAALISDMRENTIKRQRSQALAQATHIPASPGEVGKAYVKDRASGTKTLDETMTTKHHAQMMSYDVDAAKNRLASLEEETHKPQINYMSSYDDAVFDSSKGGFVSEKQKENEEEQQKLRNQIKKAEAYQKSVGYASLVNRADFAEKSQRTNANNRYDKAVYNDGWYRDKQKYADDLDKTLRAEYDRILADYGEAEADKYLMQFYNDEGGYNQKYLEELTDDEKKIFNYILNTEGDAAAEEYLRFMENTLTYRSAVRNYERAKGMSGAEQHIYGFFNDVDSGLDSFSRGLAGWFTDDEIPYTREQIENQIFIQDQGNVSKAIHSAITSSANMLPSMVVGAANPAAGKFAFGASAGGNSRQEALLAGYSPSQANRYGVLSGAAEVCLEDALGGVVALGGKGLSNALSKIPGVKSATTKIANTLSRLSAGKQTAARFAAKTIDRLSGEFTDEYLQEILDPVFRNICLGENNQFKPFTEEALFSGIVGALMAASSNAANIPYDIMTSYDESANAVRAQSIRDFSGELINQTRNIHRNDVDTARDALAQKVENRDNITFADIAAFTSTLNESEAAALTGDAYGTAMREESDIRSQLGDAENADAVAAALYRMQSGDVSKADAETVKNSAVGRELFSAYFDANISESSTTAQISEAVRDAGTDADFHNLSYEAQGLLKKVREKHGHSADAEFYKAYFAGRTGREYSGNSPATLSAYEAGADARADIGTFRTVAGASLAKETTDMMQRAAKSLGISITYGGKGGLTDGAVRRGYMNAYSNIHIYEDAKVRLADGTVLSGGDAAAQIILGHELTHVLQKQAPEAYRALAEHVRGEDDFDAEIKRYMQYGDLTRQEAMDEFVADYAMTTLFADAKTAREVTQKHSKLAEAIRNAIAWIREHIFKQDVKSVDRAAKIWNDAYNEARRNKSSTADTGNTGAKYSAAYREAEVNNDILSLVEKVKSGDFKDNESVNLGEVPEALLAKIKELTGVDVSGYKTVIEARMLYHILHDHGENGVADRSMQDQSDIAKIQYVLSKPDNMSYGGKTQAYTFFKNGYNRTAPTVLYEKKIGEKSYYAVQAVPEAKKKTLYIVSAFIGNSGYKNKAVQLIDANSPNVTTKIGSAPASGYSISNSDENVNGKAQNSVTKVKNSIATPEVDAQAKELFGKTYRWSETGYITKGGEKLDFSGKKYGAPGGSRTMDHREIADAYEAAGFDIDGTAALVDFMQAGNIRIMPESGGINLSVMPTKAQLDSLSDFISKNRGEVILDIDNEAGETVVSTEYPRGTHANRVLQDIRAYFESGKIPTLSDTAAFHTQYSTTATDEARLSAERKRSTFAEVTAGLRQQESDARKAKREFLPDMQTLGEVTRSLAEMGLADGVTQAQLSKAVQDAAVSMRAAYLERNGSEAKARNRTTAAGKLLAAARLLAREDGVTVAETAEAITEALYQTNTADRKTVKQLVEEYGAIEPGANPSRVVSVPRKTDKYRDVSKAVRTVMEARITPGTMLPTIEDAIESGDFSYEAITDKAAAARARKAVKANYQAALDKFHEDVRRGVVSKDTVTLGFELYNQAANANTEESRRTAAGILTDIVSTSRSSAQALQAMKIIKKMSPDYQLYSVERITQKLNGDLAKRNLKQSGAKKSVEDAILAGQEDARDGVANEIGELGNGVPVEKWAETVGDIVADGVAARLSGQSDTRGKTVPQTMRADLAKLANEFLPQKTASGKPRTVVDRVSDYFANRAAYEEAWQEAKQKLKEKYGGNAENIDLLDALLATTRALSDGEIDKAVAAAVREVGASMSEIIRSDAGARGETLRAVQQLLIQSGIDEADARHAADIIAERFTVLTEQKSRAALEQVLAGKPGGIRKTAEERFNEYANMGAFEGEYSDAIAEKLFGAPIKVNEKLVQQFRAAKTKTAREEILKEIYRDIGSQIPATFTEKFAAWRYISMLVNPTTHIRNVAGNAGFAPMLMTKNKIATALEFAFIRDKSQRTKSVLGLKGAELVKAAGEDFTRMGDALFSNSKYKDEVNANQYIAEGRKTFKEEGIAGGRVGKALNKLQKLNGDLLSSEDMMFKRQYYVYALASFCKARGITAEQIRSGKGLDAARAYAIREAQRATYNDANAFSDFLSRRSGNKKFDTISSLIMPFKRTPANILVRGFEYSPIGFLKSITYDLARVHDGRITAAEAIDNIAAGFTGTLVAGIGAGLAHLGFVKIKGFDGGDDDEERKFEEMYGHQQYSIEIFGKSIPLDWLAPESIPFFTGVNIYELMKDGGFTWNDVLDVIGLTLDPMMNMSMLQGINSILDSAKYSQLEAIAAIAYQIAENAVTQSLPTVIGKLERITQPDRMTTYVDKNSALPRAFQKTLGKVSQKVPGWDYGQIPYINAWGEKETNDSAAWRAFDQLLNPAYTSSITETPLEKELLLLSKEVKETDVFPSRAPSYFNVKKLVGKDEKTGEDVYETVRVDLTAQQYVNYAQFKGKASKRICGELINTSYYKNASAAQKRKMILNAYSFANDQAKTQVSTYQPTGWEAKAIEICGEYNISEAQYISLYTLTQDVSGKINGETVDGYSSLQKMRILYETSLTDEQRNAVAEALGIGKNARKLSKESILKKIKSIEEDR